MRTRIVGLLVVLGGCEAQIAQVEVSKEDVIPLDAIAGAGTRVVTPEVALCEPGRSYQGFGGNDLTLDRRELDVGFERARTKPFAALQTEYTRVLGNTPELLSQSESTFGLTPARWYPKTDPNAVSLYQAYRIAFQDSGQNFGLAAAISTVIFFMVALLSMANLKLLRVNKPEGS